MATVKIIFAVLFVVTSGALFKDYFNKNKAVSLLASCFAIISAYYLFEDIYDDLVNNDKTIESKIKENEPSNDNPNPKPQTQLNILLYPPNTNKPMNSSESISIAEKRREVLLSPPNTNKPMNSSESISIAEKRREVLLSPPNTDKAE